MPPITQPRMCLQSFCGELRDILELAGGVPRFVEAFVIAMGKRGSFLKNPSQGLTFSRAGLAWFLTKEQSKAQQCYKLLNQVVSEVQSLYRPYFEFIKSPKFHSLVSQIIAHVLFKWPLERSTILAVDVPDCPTIADLEQLSIVTFRDSRIHVPFITLHIWHTRYGQDCLRVLDFLDDCLSPDQNEMLSIKTLTFRMHALYRLNGQTSLMLSKILDMELGSKDRLITFKPDFTVTQSRFQITEKNWNDFIQTSSRFFYKNAAFASFADSIALTEPVILLQDKGRVVNRKKYAGGTTVPQVPQVKPTEVIQEYQKAHIPTKHVFLYIADMALGENPTTS